MKPKEDLYTLIAKTEFRPISGHEDTNIIVRFLYCDAIYVMAYLKKKNGRYEVHYPAVDENYFNNCEYVHIDFKKNRLSAQELTPYLFYFRSATHAKAVEKEIKLAFRRWLKKIEKENNDE